MYVLAYSSAPAPESTTFSQIMEVSDFEELVTEIRNAVFCESLKMMCADPPEDSIADVLRTLAAEENVDSTFLNAVQVLFEQLDAAQKDRSWEQLNVCVQLFHAIFDTGNFTGWDFGMNIIADDDKLADFISGDMGCYGDSREEAEQILDSHSKNRRMER